ncbi:MAG: NAD-dependent epimerase/dehydratase family protein [Desulfotignum sp.]
MTDSNPKIFVAGHRGMVGSAIVRRLNALGQTNVVTRTRQELALLNQQAVMDFMQEEQVDQVYLAA